MFNQLKESLKGRKTYIVAFLMVLVSVVNIVTGDASLQEVLASDELWVLLNGLGLGSLRAGVEKVRLDQ